MKEVKIENKEYIFAELAPNQSWNPEFPTHLTWKLEDGGTYSEPYIMPLYDLDSWRKDTKIITTTNTITEEIAKGIVEHKYLKNAPFIIGREYWYKSYTYARKGWEFKFHTALESFYSLMDSLELDRSKNYLLIEKLKQ